MHTDSKTELDLTPDDEPLVPVQLELVEEDGPEPPESWKPEAHDEDDVLGGDVHGPPDADGREAAINSFVVSADRASIGVKTFKVPGTQVLLPVRTEIAPLLIGFARDFHRRVEALEPGTCWGYAFRAVRGGRTPSFHSAGIAIDLNAPRHPLGRRGTFSAAQAAEIRRLANRYGLRWGGDYSRRADEMHAEVIVPRQRALALAAALSSPQGSNTQYEAYVKQVRPGSRVLRKGRAGDDVAALQRLLSTGADGYFGAGTEGVVVSYQRAQSLTPDGIVGPVTWARLGVPAAESAGSAGSGG